jgi:hypothetical protein
MNDTIYQAWHRNIGHTEYRLSITMAGYGNDEEAAEDFFEGFQSEHPEAGVVISQDAAGDTITATLSLAARDEQHALELGIMFWVESGVASGLSPNELLRTEIELVDPGRQESARENAGIPRVPA